MRGRNIDWCCIAFLTERPHSYIHRAIALSLQAEQPPPPPAPPVPQHAEEDEDPEFEEQLRRAIAESEATAAARQSTVPLQPVEPNNRLYPPEQAAVPHQTGTFLGDRAEMERQRLERQKRQRPGMSNLKNVIPKEEEDDDVVIDDDAIRETKRQCVSQLAAPAYTNASSSSQPSRPTNARGQSKLQGSREELFYDGELRQTANKHVDPTKDTRPVFRLSEILSQVTRLVDLIEPLCTDIWS